MLKVRTELEQLLRKWNQVKGIHSILKLNGRHRGLHWSQVTAHQRGIYGKQCSTVMQVKVYNCTYK